MKNKLKILLFGAVGVFLFTACQKDPKLNMPSLETGVVPLVTKDATKDQNVSFLNLAGFNGSVVVNTYYKDLPKSMDLMVTMNNDQLNSGVVKSGITTFPTTVNFNIASLVDILPGLDSIKQLQLGDNFKFYVNITMPDGSVINGNDTLYALTNTSIKNLPGSSLTVTYNVACALDYALTVGSYHSYSPPSDWNSEGDITLTADPDDPNKILVRGIETIEGLIEDKGPLVMHINPVTYAVTADKSVIVSDFFGYHNGAYAGTGTYNTCTGTYDMKFDITADEGTFINGATFTFTRN
jgi:hypothetical protein